MQTKLLLICVLLSIFSFTANAQANLYGEQASKVMSGASFVSYNGLTAVPNFISFSEQAHVSTDNVFEKLKPVLHLRNEDSWKAYRTDKDNIGFTHFRYQQYYYGVKVEGGEWLVHEKGAQVRSANGLWVNDITLNVAPAISEASALQYALKNINAKIYKWDIPAEEKLLKYVKNDPNATFFPKGELVIVPANGDYRKHELHLAWKFDIYADEPLSRSNVYVDAVTGKIIHMQSTLYFGDAAATANTKYSGMQSMTTDSVSPTSFRLREVARGQGIETYNLQKTTNYGGAVDFTDADNYWNNWNANWDEGAPDAHWGAESTYDYYWNIHGRNGLDGNGYKMLSYVHYSTNYNNAFWDGTRMTYGDGSNTAGNFKILTAIDVCGHEFTHGVTQNTSNLVYSYESGALNESFSDIFGTCVEWYKKPLTANFLIGEQIEVTPNTALRDMGNPGAYGDPDTYGTNDPNWYTGAGDNGGVHTNSGVQNHWFYILCQGESGTNYNSQTYNVTGIGISKAEKIAFRDNCYYLTANAQYIDSRNASIQGAQDLFGACSPEVIATTNAWYAVGVGALFSSTVTAAFTASPLASCSVPFTVTFSNTSTNGPNATWDFGDNTTSTQYNPSHTYTQPGTYTVKLIVSGACGTDSTVQTSYISINTPPAPATVSAANCTPTTFTLTASGTSNLNWFAIPTGGTSLYTGTNYVTPVLSATTTYYVENDVPQSPGNVGPPNNNFGTGGYLNSANDRYNYFDVLQPCTLVSVIMYSQAAGTPTLKLWDNAGNVLQSWPLTLVTGTNTVTLNAPLVPGTGYRLGGMNMNCYRNNGGSSFPYTLSGLVSITGTNAGNPGYYYFCYNWVIQPEDCKSVRTAVTATVYGTPSVTLTLNPDTVCINWAPFALTGGNPSGGTYSGNGVNAGMFDPSAAGGGLQTITYSYTDGNNCTGTATQNIFVDLCTGIASVTDQGSFSLYPNPSHGSFELSFFAPAQASYELRITDVSGQLVHAEFLKNVSGTYKKQIGLDKMAQGVYLVRLISADGSLVRKLVVE